MEKEIVDFELVKNNMGGNEGLVQEMFGLFLQTLPEDMIRLQTCYEKEDWTQLKATVHQLKGGASYCGTQKLDQVCKHLEDEIRQCNHQMIPQLYQQLFIELHRVKETIQNYLKDFK